VPNAAGAITLTINPGTSSGQQVRVYGGAYAVTVRSNVSSGYPEFIYTDGSTGYSWAIPASVYTQYIDMSWDGGNWRCTTSGQTIVAAATQSNAAINLGQFVSSFSGNGYQKFPGGLIIQWGLTTVTSSDTSFSVTFPVTFPTACRSVQITPFQPATNTGTGIDTVSATSTSGFTFAKYTDGTGQMAWLAVGY
jgi:hypothetical protein